MTKKYLTSSIDETYSLARQVTAKLKIGDIVALYGDLGSGKTTFSKAIAKALKINDEITSPTFVILKEYPFISKNKAAKLIHLDCYRLNSKEDLESIGYLEYLKRKDIIMLIEWPERINKYLPGNIKKIKFSYVSENQRMIEL